MLRLVSIILYFLGAIYFIMFGLYLIIVSFIFGNKFLYRSLPFLTRVQLFCLGAWVRTNKKIPNKGQYIIMMNHSSFADVFFSVQPLKGKYTAILASFNFKIPIWGAMLRAFHAIPIYRQDRKKAIKGIKDAERIINELGYHVVIFPEGTRTVNNKLQPFKKGGFHMAINTNTPIIPIAVKGAFDYKPKTRWYIKPSIINIKVGDPIEVQDYKLTDVNLLLEKTYNKIEELLK